jgi:hypothetical protein
MRAVTRPRYEFDMTALCAALDAARGARGLSWADLVAEINAPFKFVPSIPISPATIRGMGGKASVTSAVVLQVLRWLGRSPESFLSGRVPAAGADARAEALPDVGPQRILRLDTKRLHAALDEARRDRGLTWRQIVSELPGFKEGMLTNLAAGPAIGFPRVMRITQWLGRPAAEFARGYDW